MTQDEFRQKLDEITNLKGNPNKQPDLIAALNSQYPHDITLVGNPDYIDTQIDCFKYVFKDIIPSDIWRVIEQKHIKNGSISETFISELISKGLSGLHDKQEESDRIVVYFEGDTAKHFGLIEGDKVESKWGSYGHVWNHGLLEIPLLYGTVFKYSKGQVDEGFLHSS